MDELARKRAERNGRVLGSLGRVAERLGDGALLVSLEGRSTRAIRAAGCLLEPVEGDRVLVGEHEGEAWVLTVIERDPTRSAEISVPGDLRLRAPRGKVAIVAQEGIDLLTAGTTSVVSNELELRARLASAAVDGAEIVGGWIRTEVERVRLVAKSLDQLVERFAQRSKRSYREVTELDQQRAAAAHHRVDKTLRTHAGEVAMTADGIVKIDGSQIHVG